jgi:fatty-acyl-CoA synthase
VISACPGVIEAAVYGVSLPIAEGRAGMAAIAIDGTFDLATFKAHIGERLPRYAQPLFLRIAGRLELTPTFKPKKADFALEGFDPRTVKDPLYFNDAAGGTFVTLNTSLYENIIAGRIKV